MGLQRPRLALISALRLKLAASSSRQPLCSAAFILNILLMPENRTSRASWYCVSQSGEMEMLET